MALTWCSMWPCENLLLMQTKIRKPLFFSPGLNKKQIQTTTMLMFLLIMSVDFYKMHSFLKDHIKVLQTYKYSSRAQVVVWWTRPVGGSACLPSLAIIFRDIKWKCVHAYILICNGVCIILVYILVFYLYILV